jgi:3-carboxy-cis,cis-muconate cycloisomerase
VSTQQGLFAGIFGRGGVDTGDEAWLQAMLDTEAALARAVERAGLAEPGAGAAVTAVAQAGAFDAAELGRQAELTGNPVPALVRELTGMVPPGLAGAVHKGATSQDIIDTAAMLLAREALSALAADLTATAAAAAALAAAHRDTIMIGRTLLQQAVPVTFGLVAAGWLTGLDDAREAVARVRAGRLAIQFGGAAGTLASLGGDGLRVAGLLADELGLALPVLPWHTDRLRVLDVAGAAAGASAMLGKAARDITLLAQSEVAEVREGDAAGPGGSRGGSSAMPHKRNPVGAVALLGCTRQVPGLLATLAAAAEHEHQRAAGAWHAEWQPFSDLLRLAGSARRGGRSCWRAWKWTRPGCAATSTTPAACRWPSTSPRCSARRSARSPRMTWWPGPARRRPATISSFGTPCWTPRTSGTSSTRPGSPRSRSSPPWTRRGTWARRRSSWTRPWPRTPRPKPGSPPDRTGQRGKEGRLDGRHRTCRAGDGGPA